MTSIQIIILIVLSVISISSLIWSIKELRKSSVNIDFNDLDSLYRPHIRDSIAVGIISIHVSVLISILLIWIF